MAAPTPQILFYADLSGSEGGFFTVNDFVLGELDGVGVLAGDLATDITSIASVASISRGRNREVDEFTTGTATLTLRNDNREFDPTHVSGSFYGQILPGKRVDIVVGGVTIYSGVTRDWDYDYQPGSKWSEATVSLVDALGVLAAKEFDAWTSTSQLPGARIAAVLARSDVAYAGSTDIDDGVETLQADSITWGSNVLNYLQLVARSDQGRLFAGRDGTLVYRDRLHAVNDDPAMSFAPDGFGSRYHDIHMELGATFLYNRVGVDRVGGTLQTVEDTAAQAAAGLGVISLSLGGLLLSSDARSLALAQYLLSIYTDPELRLTEIGIDLHDDQISDGDRVGVLSLDLGDLVRVRFAPDGVNTDVDFYGLVEGIRHDLAPMTHRVTLSLSAADNRTFFELDHAIRGVLDGVGVLAF